MQFQDVQRVFDVRPGHVVDIGVTVTGDPGPSVGLKKSCTDVDRAKYQWKGDKFQFGPVEESDDGIYSMIAWNCFNSVTVYFTINVLSK